MTEAGTVRIATFNIQHGALGDYGRGYPELVAEACHELDADILGLQEVDVGVARSDKANLAKVAADACDMRFVFAKARTFRGRGQVGNALLVRGEMNDVKVAKLSGDRQRFKINGHYIEHLPEPRNAILARVAVRGYEISVGVTHVGGKDICGMLGMATTALLEYDSPHVLMGDYNVELPAAQEFMARHGLEVLEGPPTNPSWEPVRQIDHIAVSDLGVQSVYASHLPISDHLALVADVHPTTPKS